MRYSYLAAVALAFAVLPTTAFSQSIIAASHTCRQKVPCDSMGAYTATDWAKAGNECITEGFGQTVPEGFIDDSAGLDGSNCLTTKIKADGSKGTLLPRCCVVPTESTNCNIRCTLER